LAPGVVLHGDGGSIFAPPSQSRFGRHEWIVDPNNTRPVDLPNAWIKKIAEVMSATATTATCPRPRFQLVDDNELENFPAPEMLIDGIVPCAAMASLVGQPASGKSFLALDLAMCVATGRAWHGHAVRQGLVVYILAEGTGNFPKRVTAWKKFYQLQGIAGVKFLREPVQFMNSTDVKDLLDAIKQLGDASPALIVVDTMARCFVGGEENSAKEVGIFLAKLEQIRAQTGSTILLVHHTGRRELRERGSSALAGAADTMMVVSRLNGGDTLELACGKQKDTAPFDALFFCIRPQELSAGTTSCVLVPTAAPERKPKHAKLSKELEHALGVLREECAGDGATLTEWRRACEVGDEKESTFRHWANQLLSSGRIAKDGTGKGARYTVKEREGEVISQNFSANRSPLTGGAAVAAEKGCSG
jgi:hypothetical protein